MLGTTAAACYNPYIRRKGPKAMGDRKRYDTLDVIRIIASFFVVLVHIHLPSPVTAPSMAIARFAVPFFYLISGYFLCDPSDDTKTSLLRIKRSLKKTLRLTLAMFVLYALINCIVCLIRSQNPFYWLYSKMSTKVFIEFIILNHTDFICPIIWYLMALIYVLAVIYLLVRYNKVSVMYFLIPVLLVINLLLGYVLKLDWYYQGNWLFTALPFMLGGMFIREKKDLANKFSYPVIWILIIAGTILSAAETLVSFAQFLYIGSILLSLGLFLLGIRSEKKWPSGTASFGRNISKYVFYLHCVPRLFILSFTGLPKGVMGYLLPLIVFIISAALGIVIVFIKDKLFKAKNKTA